MKKVFIWVIAGLLAIPLMLSVCSNELKYISDGDFKYYYMEDKDSYAVIGTTPQGKEKDVLYFPAYYEDKLVTHMGYIRSAGFGFGGSEMYWIGPEDITAKKVYFPYTVEEKYFTNVIFLGENSWQIYFANCNEKFLNSAVRLANHGMSINYYVTPTAYEYIIDNVIDYGNVNIANVSFLFNYEDAPNEGYFFIDNYDADVLIQPTPYEPSVKDIYSAAGIRSPNV